MRRGENANAAVKKYAIRYPGHRSLNTNVILRLVNRVRQTGSVLCKRRNWIFLKLSITHSKRKQNVYLSFCEISQFVTERLCASSKFLFLVISTRTGFYLNNFIYGWILLYTQRFIQYAQFPHLEQWKPCEYHIQNYQYRFNINLWAGVQNNLIVSYFSLYIFFNLYGFVYCMYYSLCNKWCNIFNIKLQIEPFEMPIRLNDNTIMIFWLTIYQNCWKIFHWICDNGSFSNMMVHHHIMQNVFSNLSITNFHKNG